MNTTARPVFETGSSITGEAGDNIGRGGRSSIYFIDEAAHVEHGERIDASLASNTDCRIDCSSVSGMTNSFARRRHGGKVLVFTFHWRDDPRKDDAWYARQKEQLDPVTLAAEIDIDYRGSAEGTLIPSGLASQ
jgi:phage terminase large subunit